jgi:predicted amidohydrolase
MADGQLNIALVHDVFFGDGAEERLDTLLDAARSGGAELAVLPELPFDPWIPGTREVRNQDAEEADGPRHRRLCAAAGRGGLGVLGGAIVVEDGVRRNRALLADATGEIVSSYDKLHVPCETGFWERDHYEPGAGLTPPCDAFGLTLGLQICSDMQRPQTVTALGSMGAEVLLAPRATPPGSHERWKTVLRAGAIASACYVVSINRPRPEHGVEIGSPSLVIAPDGDVLVETVEAVTVTTLGRDTVAAARKNYPGYLDVRADLYGETWSSFS